MLHFWKQNRLLPLPTYSPRNAECKIRSSLKRFSKNLWALGTPLFTNSDSSLDAQILLDGTLWVSSHDDDWGVKKSKNQLKFIKLAKVKLEFEFKQSDSQVSFPDHYAIIIFHLNIIHKVKYDTYISCGGFACCVGECVYM